ncbi:methyltransferase [Actinoallomurus rhizosphaericola]|uniref:methyltransferase n=1 Tax=Actinoallomurus rhizosphaericola TaxID=2952536 RepID=UPI002093285D|nr:methyltransferase [Actinoallomurus rhizosphaericola]MCO5995414.1 methyltransferase [Actinoallomurus rhizosphaericola]
MSDKADLRALSDLATPWSVRVVVTLGVAEHMAAGITKIDELARKSDCDAESLARVLRHLVDKGLFQEPAKGEFTLNEAARGLLEPRVRGGLDLDGSAGRLAGAWSGLLTAVRTGRPSYETVFGRPWWEDLEANPEIAASYDALMGRQGRGVPDPAILVDDDWEDVRHVVDVGGGTGAMLAEILRAHPGVRGTLVDLPRTVARSGEVFESAGVADRAAVSAQSFLDPLPPGADVYLLASVLLDWPDDQATTLLTRCAEAAAPNNGRVVVVGGVSPGGAPSRGALLLMVMTGGKTRNLDQFRDLAAKAGLTVTAAGDGPSGRFIVESRPT